jgi:glutathione S-transferase
MSLELYYHPLASFCWKVLIALYENDTPFEPRFVDLADAKARAELAELWPFARFPLLRELDTGLAIPESSIIIEYLDQHHPGAVRFIPQDADRARETRLRDRFFDTYVHEPMQKIVTDKLRPPGFSDPHGVEQARQLLATAYDLVERDMATRTWAAGEAFGMADCAASPALFYADKVQPLGTDRPSTSAYLARLKARPSFARVLTEAEPYFAMFPG